MHIFDYTNATLSHNEGGGDALILHRIHKHKS